MAIDDDAATVTQKEAQEATLVQLPSDSNARVDKLGDPLPDKALRRFGTRRFQMSGSVAQLLLSPDETIVASISDDEIVGWDARNGKQLWQQPRHTEPGVIRVGAAGYGVRPLALDPMSGKYVVGLTPGTLTFIDPATGDSEKLQADFVGGAKSIDVSSDGKLLAVGNASGLTVCDRSGRAISSVSNRPDKPMDFDSDDRLLFGGDFSCARFSPSDDLLGLVTSEKPRMIQLFASATGKPLRDITGSDRVVRFDFSPDGSQIVTTERDVSARLYDVQSGERVWEFVILPDAAESYTSDVAFRPDGQQIAVGAPVGPDYRIRLLDPKTGTETGSLSGSGWKPWTIRHTRDSCLLYGSGWDGTIRKWDLKTNDQLPRPGGVRATGVCAMSPDGRHLAFEDDVGTIHIASVPGGDTVKRLRLPGTSWTQVVFSPDGSKLAAGGPAGMQVRVVVWDVDEETILHDWAWHEGKDPHSKIEALAFSGNGQRLAAASFRQSAAYVWDLQSDEQTAHVKHNSVYGLDVNSDGTQFVTAGWDKHIRVWQCDGGLPLAARQVGEDTQFRMYGVKLSNDQSLIAAIDMTNHIRFFDRELTPVSEVAAGDFTYGALQFSHNDMWIAVGSHNGVSVFDIESGVLLWNARDHERYIYTVDFGHRDRTILSGGSDGLCYLWDLSAEAQEVAAEPQQLVEQLVGGDSKAAFLAWMQLAKTPERTIELLTEALETDAGTQVSDSDFRRAIVGLGSSNERIKSASRERLLGWGLAGWDRLSAQLSLESLSDARRTEVRKLTAVLSIRYRRLIVLLSQFGNPEADAALQRLMAASPSEQFRKLIRSSLY